MIIYCNLHQYIIVVKASSDHMKQIGLFRDLTAMNEKRDSSSLLHLVVTRQMHMWFCHSGSVHVFHSVLMIYDPLAYYMLTVTDTCIFLFAFTDFSVFTCFENYQKNIDFSVQF